MASTLMYIPRSRPSSTQIKPPAAQKNLMCRRRQCLAAFCMLAQFTGLAGPVFIVPAAPGLGWILVGTGLFACVALMFNLAKLEADLSQLPLHRPAGLKLAAPIPLRPGQASQRYLSTPGAPVRKPGARRVF